MHPDQLAALRTGAGPAALAAATELAGDNPLATASAVRALGFDPELATAALTQAALRRQAVRKFGSDAEVMFFTRTGLEQSTRGAVAARRAARLAASGATSVADLGCGIGADMIAFARAGLRVHAVEADPDTAAVARANAEVLGLSGSVLVSTADATGLDLSDVDSVFCDPARRSATGRRVFDPSSYSPSWEFVSTLPERVPRTVLKLAPGIDHGLLPPAAEGEWVSVDGDVVEAAIWCGPLATVPRRATLLRSSSGSATGPLVGSLVGSGLATGTVAAPRRYLFDPDGAVVRAHLVAEFASTVDGTLADPTIAYVYADSPAATAFGRCYEVVQTVPIALKRMRAALREAGIGTLTILKRGSALDVERLRRDLRLSGDQTAVLVLTRVAGAPAAVLCEALERLR